MSDESHEPSSDSASSVPSPLSENNQEVEKKIPSKLGEREWDAEPDLYGIRRSGRARTKTAPFQITEDQKIQKHMTEVLSGSKRKATPAKSGSEFEESSDGESLEKTARREKLARKSAKKKKSKHNRSSEKKKQHKVKKSKRKRNSLSSGDGHDSSEDNSSDCDRRTSSRRRATKVKSYREDDAFDDEILTDSDDEDNQPLESVTQAHSSVVDDENADGIDKVLDYRVGKVGCTGHVTTIYSTDQPAVSEDGDTEEQYLIKWQNWSHFHNTWESVATLEAQRVRGMKRLENYLKQKTEYEDWRSTAQPESLEIAEYQLDMQRTLNEDYKKAERIVDKRKDKSGQLEYFVKWRGLPYVECSWEAADLMERYFMTEILAFEERQLSKKLPMSVPSNQRPKFQPYTNQPDYLGESLGLQLRDYQVTGLNWLAASWCNARSCILADEMGLGKTIQTISFISFLFHDHKVYGPNLVVVPLSTMGAWLKEFDLWAKEINVVPYIGDMKSREIIRNTEWTQKNRRLKFNVIVTTYEILMKDRVFLHNIQWSVLMVDEAHRLKNDDSLLYKSLIEFSTQHRLLITGTPLQNSLRELWALLHFIEPSKFDSWEDFEENNQPSRGGLDGYTRLHRTIKPFFLRRLKKEVEKSLPAKVEQILRVDMSKIQKQYYKWILTRNYEALNRGLKGSTNSLLNIIVELKKCCNHPWLIRPLDPDNEPSDQDKLQQIVRGGGKLWLLDKLLVRLFETKHRVLIFSQMVMMLDILAEYLTLRNFTFQRLDGSITGDQRKRALDSFNSESSKDFCFLLSTRAGGLGVNLATADTVIIFDSDWNPQNDIQAQSRAHRIGQTKQVNIYRLVTKFSVEEDIIERAKKKMVLDHLVIQRMDTSGRTVINGKSDSKQPFNKEELNTILKFGAEELFKEVDGEEQDLLDFDIEDFLSRAETHEESDQPQTVGEELLAGFKVANFNYDDDEDIEENEDDHDDKEKHWDDIIPQASRDKVSLEEDTKAQSEMFLPPRQRTKVKSFQINFSKNLDRSSSSESESDEEASGAHHGTTTRATRTSATRKSKSEFKNWSDTEIRAFVRSLKKFPNAENRLQEIAEDAELHEKSMTDLNFLYHKIKENCEIAVSEANKENVGLKTSKSAFFKIRGVSINAAQLIRSQEEFDPLFKSISALDSSYNYILPFKRRLPNWDVVWEFEHDNHLIIGIYLYGVGNWDTIKGDDRLQLQDKILLDSEQKPQGKHLHTRVEYLLRGLDNHLNPRKKQTAGSPDKGPTTDKKKKRALKKERKELEKALKKEKKQREAASKKKVFKSKEEVEDDDESSDDSDNLAEDGSEEGEVIPRKVRKSEHKPIMSSPLKILKVRACVTEKQNDGDSGLHSPDSTSLTNKHAAMNDIPVKNNELNFKSDTFKTCKEEMRAVKKSLQKLTQSSGISQAAAANENTVKCLARVGEHILTIIDRYGENEAARKKKNELWNFVSQFSKLDAEALHSMFLNSRRSQSSLSGKSNKVQSVQYKHSAVSETDGNKTGHVKKIRESVFDRKQSGIRKPPFQPKVSKESSPPGSSGHQRKRIFENTSKLAKFMDEGHARAPHHNDSLTDREKSRSSKSGDSYRRSHFHVDGDSADYRRNSSHHDWGNESSHNWERPRHYNAPNKSRPRREYEENDRYNLHRNKHWNAENDGRKHYSDGHWHSLEQKGRSSSFVREEQLDGSALPSSRDPRTMKNTHSSEPDRYYAQADHSSIAANQWYSYGLEKATQPASEVNDQSLSLNLPHGAIAIDLNTPHSSEIVDIKMNNNLDTCPSPLKDDSLKGEENLHVSRAPGKSPDSIDAA